MFFFQRSTPWLVRPTPFERQRSLRGPDSARLDRQRFDSDFQDGRRDLRAPFADGLFTIQSRLRVRSLHKRRRCHQGCGETWQLWDQVLTFMFTQSFEMLDVLALHYRIDINFVLNYFSLQLKRIFLSIYITLYCFRPNHQLGVMLSVDNRKLFISSVPEDATEADVQVLVTFGYIFWCHRCKVVEVTVGKVNVLTFFWR